MMRSSALLCALLLAAPLAAVAAPAASLSPEAAGAIVSARHDIQDAVNRGAASDLLGVRAALLSLSESEQAAPPALYTLALCDWRLAPLWLREHADQKDAVLQYVDEGLAAARALEKQEPKNGEAYALESSLLGLKMMSADADVMTLGPASMQAMAKATKLEPANPRVLLLHGMAQLFTPPQFGGGAKPAIATLLQAAEAAKTDAPADSLSPAWGHDDIHAWLGQAYMQNDQFAESAAALKDALAINPACGMALGMQHALAAIAPKESAAPPAKAGK